MEMNAKRCLVGRAENNYVDGRIANKQYLGTLLLITFASGPNASRWRCYLRPERVVSVGADASGWGALTRAGLQTKCFDMCR
jgi:hypothetical protein